MPVPDTGELRFSVIATEFEDDNPIRLSHYFKNVTTVDTSYISSFPNTFNEFKLSLFRGKKKGPPTPVASSIPDHEGLVGTTYFEIITGLYANNITRSEGTTSFDNRGTTDVDSDNNVSYPNLIIQAKPGDVINLIGRVKSKWRSTQICEFWVWLGSSWSNFESLEASFGGSTQYNNDFSVNYTIPPSTVAGNYAFAVASYAKGYPHQYRSWKSYSLHVWE